MPEQPQRSRLRTCALTAVATALAGITLASCADAPAGRAVGALSAPTAFAAAGGCSSTQPIAARDLARPVSFRRCLVGKKVRGPAQLVVRIPRAGSQVCGHAFVEKRAAANDPSASRAIRIDLCVNSTRSGIYAGVHRRGVAPACATSDKINATSISVPVPKSDCSLIGRLVVYKKAGVHVPRSGGVCADALAPTYEVELCVITDRFGTWATHRYYTRPS